MDKDCCRVRKLQCEDKRKVIFVFLENACDEFPEYSAGDILYTVLRHLAKDNGQSLSFLRGVSNKELFEEIDYRLFEEKGV